MASRLCMASEFSSDHQWHINTVCDNIDISENTKRNNPIVMQKLKGKGEVRMLKIPLSALLKEESEFWYNNHIFVAPSPALMKIPVQPNVPIRRF